MKIVVLSCSLRENSRSRIMALEAQRLLRAHGADATMLDLRQHPLPFCDGEDCDPEVLHPVESAIESADAILMAVPIYNYDVNAVAKNLVEQAGSAFRGKIVGFLCAAGGHGSYMSVMSLANSLMLDFRCLIVPRFVYATGEAFAGGKIASEKINERMGGLCAETLRVARALARTSE